MTTVPTPRFDLLKMRHYLFGNVQFSRGCPFQCEFCDIIVTFGRKPRLKTSRADPRRARRLARPGRPGRVHRRRQPDRQQEGHPAGAPRPDRLAGAARLPDDVLHRGLARPGRGARADEPDGRGEHRQRLRRHREPQRVVAARDQEVPERPARGDAWPSGFAGSRTRAWK